MSILPVAQISTELVHQTLNKLTNEPAILKQQKNALSQRKIQKFGYDYFTLVQGDSTYTTIPTYLIELSRACHDALALKHLDSNQYNNIIISYYEKNDMLEPHVDVEEKCRVTGGKAVNFYFDEDVLGLILQPDKTGKLYLVKAESEIVDKRQLQLQDPIYILDETAGTIYLLTGKARHRPYYHGVSKVSSQRISITFRTLHFIE